MILPTIHFHLSDADKGILGNIFGAVIGAVGAYIVAALVARRTRRDDKQKYDAELKRERKKHKEELEQEHQKQEDKKLAAYSRSVYKAEANIQTVLPFLLKDLRLLKQIAELAERGNTMMTLPVTIELDKSIAMNFRNEELINYWLTTCMRADMTNQLIIDFKEYYVRTTNEMHTMLLHGQRPDNDTAYQDFTTLRDFATDVFKGVQNTVDNLHEMGALVTVHAENINDQAVLLKTMKQVNDYRVPKKRHTKALKYMQKRFNPANMFQDLNTNPPGTDPTPRADRQR